MKKIISVVLVAFLLASLTMSCKSGHGNQSWHPKTSQKPKAGHNRK